MQKSLFNFHLPEELIAQYPLANRPDSRLLVYQETIKSHKHDVFHNLTAYLRKGDLLVMNDSRVIPARLYGKKATGGKIELLIERVISDNSFLAHIKASKAPKAGTLIDLDNNWQITVLDKTDDLYCCAVNGEVEKLLQQIGHMPLPPYITREDKELDLERYQTVYAKHNGSVAAPTAGLHFDNKLLDEIKKLGVEVAYATLHVGSGTFRPVRTDDILEHKMHSELFSVSDALCAAVKRTKALGGRVIAVGTTAIRSLESACVDGEIKACHMQDTNIFIYPGYKFKVIDGLITNFHLPESTLLMLVSAFIGHQTAMSLYQMAIDARYRFFSYGDASLLLRA